MISGAHVIIYTTNPEADRAFFKDVLKFKSVDVGDGWLIFGLPPSEVAFHPDSENNSQEFYLMTDNVRDFVSIMKSQNINCSTIQDQGWGLITQLTLPGGGSLGVYEPRHARP